MFTVAALYKFIRIEPARVGVLRESIYAFCAERNIRGLFLLGTEGCNATMAGAPDAMQELLAFLRSQPEIGALSPKISDSDSQPFDRLKVEERQEIVTLNRPDIFPEPGDSNHLSPAEWHQTLTSGGDFLLLDTRNAYETEVGVFRNAIDPQLEQFSDFPEFVKTQDIPKDKKILMYCTGGIRCEKALVYMNREGYQNVYQLDGGILNYLEQYPDGEFEGECFVFDRRIAVDRELKPTRQWTLCPLCGDPAKESVVCGNCGKEGVICRKCASNPLLRVCSQNCEYHFARLPKSCQ
ncbi:MAG: hypothetical protein H7145_19815 [Akkermansiaceae bacterium]|nr:hypothetical protein [Armatimonadota bacterium]